MNMKVIFIFTYLRRALAALLFALACALPASAQAKPERPIQDNSFLLEEAYNQEAGVVQHISAFTRLWASRDWAYSFTQEWPLPGSPRHQLSYTLVANSSGAFPGSGAGLGDSLLNYRYQVLGDGDSRVAFAPRLSLIAPSGDSRAGRGFGGYGMQVNLPLSLTLGQHFVTHWNAGTTLVPRASNAAGDRAFTTGYNLGQSTIWLARPRFNVILETVWNGAEGVVGRDRTQRSHSLLLNPGLRWSHRFRNGLEIVPGVGVPLGVGPSAGERGIFVYLSFEHPMFGEAKREAKQRVAQARSARSHR